MSERTNMHVDRYSHRLAIVLMTLFNRKKEREVTLKTFHTETEKSSQVLVVTELNFYDQHMRTSSLN